MSNRAFLSHHAAVAPLMALAFMSYGVQVCAQDDLDALLTIPSDVERTQPNSTPDGQNSGEAEAGPANPPAQDPGLATLPVQQLANHAEPESTEAIKPTQRRLEEIVVVAQKKAELIQDVPISISVVDQEFISEWSITDVNTATLFTPNVKVNDAGYFIMPRIRGFGTDQNNKAFEPPAGVAIDGIPYTRLEYFTAAMFDISRMEVYRGPQGTAFGKNTTAGLIHLITNSPTEEAKGFIDIQRGDYDRRRIEAAVGGPIIDGFLNYRIAGLADERNGWVVNSAGESLSGAPSLSRGTKRQGARLKLDFVDLFGSSLKLNAESVAVDAIGAGLEMYRVSDNMQAAIRRYDPQTDFTFGNNTNTINDPDYRKIRTETYTAEWRYQLGDWDLVGLGGYSVLDNAAALDTDATPAGAVFASDKDKSPTVTGEFRIESPRLDGFLGFKDAFGVDLGSSNLLVGLYYQGRDINGDGIVYRVGLSYLDLMAASEISSNGSIPAPLLGVITQVYPLVPAVFGETNSSYTEEATQDFDQQAKADAVFSQFGWQFSPSWGIEYGVRFNHETKHATFNQYYSSDNPPVLFPVLNFREFTADKSISESNIAHRASLNFEPNEDVGVFLHWAKGFRGGGFNAFSFDGSNGALSYGPETGIDWGLDFKSTLLDGRMRLNASLYRLTVDDFQVLTGTANQTGVGFGETIVENASKARSQGIEADMTWLVFDWFTLFSTFGMNDTKYLDFKTNACSPDNPNSDGDSDPRCDATGKPFPLTPTYNGSMLGMLTLPLTHGLAFQLGGGFDYQSSYYTTAALDDRFRQESVMRWRASAGVGSPEQRWSFRLQAENITDERIIIRSGQLIKGVPVAGFETPRTIYGTFRYDF